MPFKIVQTIEKGNIVLTCVPHQWESDGVLYWPRKQTQSQTSKLQKDEGSWPDESWEKINCAVKRRSIKTYQNAIHEIDIMSNNSDTEPDIEYVSSKKQRNCSDLPQLSYDNMAEEILKNNEHNASSAIIPEDGEQIMVTNYEITTPKESTPSETPLSAPQENIEKYIVIPESNQSDTPIIYSYINKETSLSEEQCELKSMKIDITTIKSDLKSINDDMKTIMGTLNTTLNNQAVLHETLKSILLQVTEIQVTNEEFIKKSITEKQNHSLMLKPIQDLKDLEEFENKLMDSDYREDLLRKFSVFGTKGTGKGITRAYTIIDILFERKFFKSCSWTGASRSQNETTEKICLKGFSKMIGFFFEVIYKQDSSFHLTDCHNFFKTILRNADQRAKSKQLRTSASKCRGKNSAKRTSSENPTSTPQTTGNQLEVEDVTEEILSETI
ncbi:uncharacterized protein LOC126054091 isoform X3 [Helicoverpa armigera]